MKMLIFPAARTIQYFLDRGKLLSIGLIAILFSVPRFAFSQVEQPVRGGIEFTFGDASLISIGDSRYLDFDILASCTESNQRLGTGIVFVNYNTAAFGSNLKTNGNLILTAGSLIATSPFPFYNLITNDNSTNRLAVTYEYLFSEGYGSLLTTTPQQLLNLKIRVQQFGTYSGFSFQQSLMQNQQYMDNNSTLFTPVLAGDTEDVLIPQQPRELSLEVFDGEVNLTWEQLSACVYSVYSADDLSGDWQLEASGLPAPSWNCLDSGAKKFFRVTASGFPGSR